MSPTEIKPGRLLEKDFQRRIIELARLLGYRVYHHRPAMIGKRYVTALEGDAGFPDLILLKPPRLVIAELKVKPNKPSPAQVTWLEQLRATSAETYLWFPEDWDQAVRILSQGRIDVAAPPTAAEVKRYISYVGKNAR